MTLRSSGIDAKHAEVLIDKEDKMTEEQRGKKSVRNILTNYICSHMLMDDKEKQRFKEFFKLDISFKKDKLTISLPFSYFKEGLRAKGQGFWI